MSRVVVVVANASDTLGLASQTIDDVAEFGYVFVIKTDGLQESEHTAVYFAEGYEGEAERLADQLGVDRRLVAPLPDEQILKGTSDPDVVLWLGNDWRQATNLGLLDNVVRNL